MTKIVIANWKMNGDQILVQNYKQLSCYYNLIVCPPMTLIGSFENCSTLGAQDVSIIPYAHGAFTGEVSALFLKTQGVKYVLIGHSERRKYCDENNEILKIKLLNVLRAGITPILCIGENLQEYQSNKTEEVLKCQLEPIMAAVDEMDRDQQIFIAYEPIWSIGTGIIPTVSKIENVFGLIKQYVSSFKTKSTILFEKKFKLLYGGSVNEQNILELKNWPVDGFLVGGAALDINKITCITKSLV
ncbi:triose-phosphate isomerase family protein [Rickettsiales endosymbiont of Stachyamoeba lipophora]|uniref:triose-phosphate isomerase family protein n=1 Tax=Rickettsiales endosymbiont of Stachyamoeba lipophora TaxID=2486578 RepID=UPI000F64A4E9|nr:triose-phosphate isomerase family protein [Rickettsiales endosymbiont of Stachyamoeba lipophora]AZL15476.1 triosephosphate isomerase [Rickettsiales endosymbiont of Stachyamoeba lipophora]